MFSHACQGMNGCEGERSPNSILPKQGVPHSSPRLKAGDSCGSWLKGTTMRALKRRSCWKMSKSPSSSRFERSWSWLDSVNTYPPHDQVCCLPVSRPVRAWIAWEVRVADLRGRLESALQEQGNQQASNEAADVGEVGHAPL